MTDRPKVLVADDEPTIRQACARTLEKMGFEAYTAATGTEAVEIARKNDISFVLLDIKMPGMDGLTVLAELKKLKPETRAIIITGAGSMESAVVAMRLGASDYLMKEYPQFSLKELREAVLRVFGNPLAHVESAREEEEFFGLVGRTPAMLELRRSIELVALSDVTALIVGETGTGKELVARAIHRLSSRADKPFVAIDCSIIGERIAESELFGHKKGAFTDAHSDRIGLLQAAGKGTVFLDEITNIPIEVQAKLLRALQEKEIRPIGSEQTQRMEARVLAASNTDVLEAVKLGRFRHDLFYRLHVFPINVPPLRDRKDDFPLLVRHFVRKHGRPDFAPVQFEDSAIEFLKSYGWPGNVRELESFVRLAITVSPAGTLSRDRVEELLSEFGRFGRPEPSATLSLEETEREAIVAALSQAGGDKRKAAKALGLALSTLYRKIKKFRIDA
ncbi:MAG: sigma-54-dependent Fis family transcriptional regulator [Candidatus Eisenbacteria bacterium]|nr:sigma-54-dependent Fis family transcriptional regulator [Candidatus Eisenbacteria bacterium]